MPFGGNEDCFKPVRDIKVVCNRCTSQGDGIIFLFNATFQSSDCESLWKSMKTFFITLFAVRGTVISNWCIVAIVIIALQVSMPATKPVRPYRLTFRSVFPDASKSKGGLPLVSRARPVFQIQATFEQRTSHLTVDNK